MEFNFDIQRILENELTCLTPTMTVFKTEHNSNCHSAIAEIIDKMGEYSALAQRLPQVVTNFRKFKNSNHKLFVLSDLNKNCVLGILKFGRKRLFIHDKNGVCVETEPLCVLDFYVHESKQRQGCGKRLFDKMLEEEHVTPRAVAIDSPSSKMLQFLQRHYGLKHAIFASNNYVIFPGFFEEQKRSHRLDVRKPSFEKETSVGTKQSSPMMLTGMDKCNRSQQRSSLLKQERYFEPHTRIQAMPTSMTVIRPKVDPEPTKIQPTSCTPTAPPSSGETLNQRSVSSKQNSREVQEPVKVQKPSSSPKMDYPTTGDGNKMNYPVLSSAQLNIFRSLPYSPRKRGTYTYVNAVRHHNGHTRLW